jgi:hypothetical protein
MTFRALLIILSAAAVYACQTTGEKAESNSHDMIFGLRNPEVKEYVKKYFNANLRDYSKGVITIRFNCRPDTTSYILSSTLFEPHLEVTYPLFYTEVESVPVIFYAGIEREVLLSDEYFNELREKIKPHLEKVPSNYNPPVWRLDMASGQVVKMVVLN